MMGLPRRRNFVFSIVIATHDSERALVATLAALVPGATAGIVREVIVADGGSTDETEQVADIAGCSFFSSSEPLGARLKAAASGARGTWLMFLPPGAVPGPSWIDETIAFVEQTDRKGELRAAAFASGERDLSTLIRGLLGVTMAAQGLIIQKSFYETLGGHPDTDAAATGLLRRIGRRRIVTLHTAVTHPDI